MAFLRKFLGKLHDTLKSEELKTSSDECQPVYNHGASRQKYPYAMIEDSKLSTEHGTYAVTIKFTLQFNERDGHDYSYYDHAGGILPEYWLYPPIEALQKILQSVNSDFVPSGGEKRIPTTETAARMKDKQFVRRYEKLMPDLTPLEGQKTRSDVVNRHTKEIILPAGRKITRAILVRFVRGHSQSRASGRER